MKNYQSAKDFLIQYVQRKRLNKKKFAQSLGLSHGFLDSGKTLTVENLQKILNHPDYEDFNYEALLRGRGDVIKSGTEVPDGMANQTFIYDTMEWINEIDDSRKKSSEDSSSQAINRLRKAIKLLAELSVEFHHLRNKYLELSGWVQAEFKVKE